MLTLNPPQSHSTKVLPTTGTALTKLVITVAAQKLICPQGRTYPKKAVRIANKKITLPTNQTFLSLYLLKNNPRKMWMYIKRKNIDAPLACANRINHPSLTSRMIKSTLRKASAVGA